MHLPLFLLLCMCKQCEHNPDIRPSTINRTADSRASVARLHAAVKMLDINMLRPDKGGDPVRIDSRIALRSRFGSMDFSLACARFGVVRRLTRSTRRVVSSDARRRLMRKRGGGLTGIISRALRCVFCRLGRRSRERETAFRSCRGCG